MIIYRKDANGVICMGSLRKCKEAGQEYSVMPAVLDTDSQLEVNEIQRASLQLAATH